MSSLKASLESSGSDLQGQLQSKIQEISALSAKVDGLESQVGEDVKSKTLKVSEISFERGGGCQLGFL